MGVAAGIALSVHALPGWSVFFAKEPAPAGDAGQTPDMDKTVVLGPPGKKGPTPPSNKERLLFLILVLVIAGAGGYLAMNPDFLANLLGDAPGEMPPAPPPKVAKPATPPPAPVQPAAAPAAPAPAAPAIAPAQPAASAPAQAPAPVPVAPAVLPIPAAPAAAPKPVAPASAPVASVPAHAPVSVAPAAAKPSAPAAVASVPAPVAPAPPVAIRSPKFGEGQKVFVGAPIRLTADSAGTKPGPATAKPGSALKVLDADLHNNAWVYSVRTQQGATGWIAEKNLRAKK